MITKLADRWRKESDRYKALSETTCLKNWIEPYSDMSRLCSICADKLEAALPVWTRITEDENTLPPKGEMVMLGYPDGGHKSIITIIETKWAASGHYIGKAWRPLCDLDYPPEEKK